MEALVYSVSQITDLISGLIDEAFPQPVWVEGEVSNLTYHSSGHVYFSLKDEGAVLKAVLFKRYAGSLRFRLEEGLAVSTLGRISLYPKGGQYQLVAEQVKPLGVGELALAFEQLKERLRDEGLFDEKRKRALPFLIQRIGIVTSETGAAIRDMLKVIWRRHPSALVILAPAKVQGEGAAQSIVEGIEMLCADGRAQVIIIGRGGGSMEDLWAFNEEAVARAVFESPIPVVSAVGHEVDFVISDFVADKRAATPTAAGELVTQDIGELRDWLSGTVSDLEYFVSRGYSEAGEKLTRLMRHPGLRRVQELLDNFAQDIDRLQIRFEEQYSHSSQRRGEQMIRTVRDLLGAGEQLFNGYVWNLREAEGRLSALNPQGVLERGYSVISRRISEEVVFSTTQVRAGEALRAGVSDGEIDIRVEKDESG